MLSRRPPEDGWWWNPAESGRRFNIEVQDRTVFVATFVYNNEENPIWYLGAGELNVRDTLSTTLTRSESGQCIGCTPSSSTSTNVMPITVKFNGPTKGTVTWAGINTPTERFNFALGNEHRKLLGEWALVEGSPRFSVYFGDRLIFAEIKEDGKLWGSITGAPDRPVIVTRQDALGYHP